MTINYFRQLSIELSVIFDMRALLTFRGERQSARMSKITNNGLIQSGGGCFIAVPIWQRYHKGY